MKPESDYERLKMIITEFDTEDVITTSGDDTDPVAKMFEKDNRFSSYDTFTIKKNGGWF